MPPSGITESLSEAVGRTVSRERVERLEAYVALLKAGAAEQNLIARSTLDSLWDRHINDSAQLVRYERRSGSSWVDVGSGAGLPGVVIALLVDGPITLVEPRRLRADFLQRVVNQLGLSARITVIHAKVERMPGTFDVITARAVAPLPRLLEISSHLSTKKTIWALPRGRGALTELAEVKRAWQGVFHVEQSVTDDDSYIVVASGVGKKP